MQKYLRFSTLSLATMACACLVAQTASRQLVKQWQARYDEGAKVYATKDADGLAALLTPDWRDYAPGGRILHKSNDKEPIVAEFKAMKTMSAKFRVTGVKLVNGKAVVSRSVILKCVMNPGPDKVEHNMVYTSNGLETWVKRDGKWLISETRALREDMTMDGKHSHVHSDMKMKRKG